jgi:hypothetical protein
MNDQTRFSPSAAWLGAFLATGAASERELERHAAAAGHSTVDLRSAFVAIGAEISDQGLWRLSADQRQFWRRHAMLSSAPPVANGAPAQPAPPPARASEKDLRIATYLERYRIEAILTSPQAIGRTALAHQLAFHSDEPAEAAIRALAQTATGATPALAAKAPSAPHGHAQQGRAGLFERRRRDAGHGQGAAPGEGAAGSLFHRRREQAGHATPGAIPPTPRHRPTTRPTEATADALFTSRRKQAGHG